MVKVMMVCHRSQVSDLLEALQTEGICQVLNAEEATVSKDAPELAAAPQRPKDVEAMIARLGRGIDFLNAYAAPEKGLAGMLAPQKVIAAREYEDVVSDTDLLDVVDACERLVAAKDRTTNEIETLEAMLAMLRPWASLATPVEELGRLRTSTSWAGLIPAQQIESLRQHMAEQGAALQEVGTTGTRQACIVVSLHDSAEPVQKLLRAHEFDAVSFEPMAGTVSELIDEHERKLREARSRLEQCEQEAASLAGNLLKLQILHDHYDNLLVREQTGGMAPATEHAVILEGWVKKRHYDELAGIVSKFEAAGLSRVEPGEDEDVPVEIENRTYVRPFESITRLYGMPQYSNLDPTVFLAPFFAVFFGLCLTDAGYGLIMIVLLLWLLKKVQGDAKMIRMFVICSIATVVAGALTGGWFGDTIQVFFGGDTPEVVDTGFEKFRAMLMWFDPIKKPMIFFILSMAVGYFQVIFGICVALWHNLKKRDHVAAAFDQVTWLVMLNSLVLLGFAKAGMLPSALAGVFGVTAAIPAVAIVLFSEREGGWGQRLGMGAYNLFSTVFFVGDVLSYARLMALGMVTAGFAMAVNVIVKMVADIKVPVLGFVLALIIFVGGHLFNAGMSVLSAFVHTLRLQFVEYFPKFFVGGGRSFEPLAKKYKHVCISEGPSDTR